MSNSAVKKYEIVHTKTSEAKSCEANDRTCTIEVAKTGTYKVTAYDANGSIIATNQYFNVKISKNGPRFTISGPDKTLMSKTESASGTSLKKKVTYKIIKDNINEEYNTIKYQINNGEEKEIGGLTINEELSSGHYELNVIVSNFAGEETSIKKEFDISYLIDIEYDDDHSKTTHEVVTGKTYNYLSSLPTHKNAYGHNLEIRWHLLDERIYPASKIVEANYTHKLVGKMSIPVQVEDFTKYCNTLTYNGNSQILTKTAPENVSFINNTGINAGEYTITARINSPQYIWQNGNNFDFNDKAFKCSIGKKQAVLTCENKTYTGSAQNLYSDSTGCSSVTDGTQTNVKSDGGSWTLTCNPDSNHTAPSTCTAKMNRKTLSVIAAAKSRSYNTDNPALTYTYSGQVSNQTPKFTGELSTTATKSSNVGTYDINQNTLAIVDNNAFIANNYSISYTKGLLTINKVAATLTCKDRTYNGSAQNLYSDSTGCSSVTNGSQTNVKSDGGSWTLTCNPDGNHTAPSTCTAKMNRKTLSVTAEAKSKYYYADNPALTYTYSGQVTNQTPKFTGSLSTTATKTSNVGTYDINQNTLTIVDNGTFVKNNYSISYTKALLTINKVSATLTCEDKTYNGSAQNLYSASTGCSSVTNGSQTNVKSDGGSWTLTCNPDGNHTAPSTCTAKMNRKTLSVTAEAKSKNYNTDNPALTYTYSGQVANQTPKFTGSLSTAAIKTSNAGKYDINQNTLALTNNGAFVANNYSISYTKAQLTINKISGYVNIDGSSGTIGKGGTGTFTVSSSHGGTLSCSSNNTSVATCSMSDKTVTMRGVATGTAKITVTSAATTNYNSATSSEYTVTVSCCPGGGIKCGSYCMSMSVSLPRNTQNYCVGTAGYHWCNSNSTCYQRRYNASC